MKKYIFFILFLFIGNFIFSQSFHISNVQYEITGASGLNIGKTNENKLEMKYPINKNIIFKSKEDFDIYISNYKLQLQSSRLFQEVYCDYEYVFNPQTNVYDITVIIKLEDSNHLIALPYPKYSSNSGLTLKVKAKDSNFLGTLNPLSTEINFNWKDEISFGLNFSYDFPFKAGPFNAVWNNSFNTNYTLRDKSPEVGTSTGIIFTLPFDYAALNFGFTQSLEYDRYYKLNLGEKIEVSSPISLFKFNNYTSLDYKPYINFLFQWYIFNGKPYVDNEKLNFCFGHSIENSNITFNDYFRKGYSFLMSNDFVYYIRTGSLNPSFTIEAKYYNNWHLLNGNFLSRFGLSTRLYAHTAIDIPNRDNTHSNVNLGEKVRGVLDNRINTPCGIVLNIDLPFSIFTTNFKWKIINFNMQVSPFIDIALAYDESNVLNIKKGSYCAGIEILINPIKFSSYTIRASFGFDAIPILKADNFGKALLKYNEIYIGLDYHF